MSLKFGISIINYKTADLTLTCLRSVLDDIGALSVRIAVVDNASNDGSAEAIETWIAAQPAGTPVTLIRSETNSGFSGGHNLGMAALEGCGYFLILNSDAVLRPGFLAALAAAVKRAPEAGLIAPQIETEEGEVQISCFRFASPTSEFLRGIQSGPVDRLFRHRLVPLMPPVQPADVEWASFACILLKAEMVAQIGLMDEGYFLYFEDVEYCLRARLAGWRIALCPESVVVHYRGGSGPVKALAQARKRLPPYYYASRTRFFRQAHGVTGPLRANLMWLLGRFLTQGRRLLAKPVAGATDCEMRDIWINFGTPLGPRRAPGEV